MERMTILDEYSGQRIACMLNPNNLVVRRQAGVKPLESLGGLVAGSGMADVPLLNTNGGWTELSLDLVFDVTIPGSSVTSQDVRDLTRPLWNLSENVLDAQLKHPLRLCRVLWGRAFNFAGVITSIAERLEYFTPDGFPRRSWLRMIMRRVMDNETDQTEALEMTPEQLTPTLDTEEPFVFPEADGIDIEEMFEDEESLLRIDLIAQNATGSDRNWRHFAAQYGIDNPLEPLKSAPGSNQETV